MDVYSEIGCKLNKSGIEVSVPVKEFIELTSNLYHKYESKQYDATQFSILDSIEYWNKAFAYLDGVCDKHDALQVLDFGCGTGFETKLLLQSELIAKCKTIYCYDLSIDMLNTCRMNIGPGSPGPVVKFISDKHELQGIVANNKFDLIITNSLLHHIPVPEELVAYFMSALSINGYYLCGHEPNRSFYFNVKTTALTSLFRFFKRLKTRISIKYLKEKVQRTKAFNKVKSTNEELIKLGLINKPIPNDFLLKLIDIHVPLGNKNNQIWGKMGFDRSLFEVPDSTAYFEVIKYYTYSHIKDPLSNKYYFWRKLKRLLAKHFPDDGGDFLALVKKVGKI